jgi:nicotinamidase-related amidase
MKSTLIIIDMQQGLFASLPRFDAAHLVERLNAMAGRVRANGGKVIFVQHDGPAGDCLDPKASGWRLLPDLDCQPSDVIVRKQSCDAFLNSDLALRVAGAEQLVITGCATDYCVDTTVRSALGRGYRTLVPADGHTTADRPHLRAEQIIAHHNAIWADFLAPAGPAEICRCSEIV